MPTRNVNREATAEQGYHFRAAASVFGGNTVETAEVEVELLLAFVILLSPWHQSARLSFTTESEQESARAA